MNKKTIILIASSERIEDIQNKARKYSINFKLNNARKQ